MSYKIKLNLNTLFILYFIKGKMIMQIIYDEYSKNKAINFINNYKLYNSNGKISFKPKEKNKPLEKGDYLDKVIDDGLVYNLIIDGEYVVKNMEKVGKDKKWINHYLKVNGYKLSDILLLTIDGNDKVMVYKR